MRRAAAAIALLALTSCVWPGTRARVVFDPQTSRFEGELERSWLAGDVDMEAAASRPGGGELRVRWKSNVNLEAASAAYAKQSELIAAGVQAGASLADKKIP